MIQMKIIILFAVCTAINVILSTIKSILTVKGSPVVAATANAITYGFYTYLIILTSGDGVSTLAKMIITAVCNFIGVYLVKLFEAKARKDRLWEIRATIPARYTAAVHLDLKNIPHNYIEGVGKYTVFNIYCATQKESMLVKPILNQYDAKYFVSEGKDL